MWQDELQVALGQLAQADMRDRLLARSIAVADRNFARSNEGRAVAQGSGAIDANLRANSLGIGAWRRLNSDLQPVPSWRFVGQEERLLLGPPVRQKHVEVAVAVVVTGRAGSHIDHFSIGDHLVENV